MGPHTILLSGLDVEGKKLSSGLKLNYERVFHGQSKNVSYGVSGGVLKGATVLSWEETLKILIH